MVCPHPQCKNPVSSDKIFQNFDKFINDFKAENDDITKNDNNEIFYDNNNNVLHQNSLKRKRGINLDAEKLLDKNNDTKAIMKDFNKSINIDL